VLGIYLLTPSEVLVQPLLHDRKIPKVGSDKQTREFLVFQMKTRSLIAQMHWILCPKATILMSLDDLD
jgi:hypothetical protein